MKAQASPRQPRRSKEEWRQLINQFEQTELSDTEFCQQQNIPYQSFAKWRSTLRSKHAATLSPFIEITPDPSLRQTVGSSDWAIELVIGHQLILRIRQPQ